MKFNADALSEIKSTHCRSDFTHRRCISHCEAIFHPPERVDLVDKSSLWAAFVWPARRDNSLSFYSARLSVACGLLHHGAARRAKNLPPEGFLNALSNPFVCNCSKEKKQSKDCFFLWPARRDLNPRSSESESAALSNCATGGYILYLLNAIYYF